MQKGTIVIPAETALLRQFIQEATPPYDDHRTEIPLTTAAPAALRDHGRRQQWWQRLNAPRIDAICVRRGEVDLVEVKQVLTWSALAQALLYRELWRDLRPHTPSTRVIIVVGSSRTDILQYAATLGIHVAQVDVNYRHRSMSTTS